ncbi:MAG: hypothetical protein Q8L98_02500 [Chlamydiales bacterium]|nr:hypothetical protein [Chlamydiales bacterium]
MPTMITHQEPSKEFSFYFGRFTRKTFKAATCTVGTLLGAEIAHNLYQVYAVPYIYQTAQASAEAQGGSVLGSPWLAGHMAGQSAVSASRRTLEPASKVIGGGLGFLAGAIVAELILFTYDKLVLAIARLFNYLFPLAKESDTRQNEELIITK